MVLFFALRFFMIRAMAFFSLPGVYTVKIDREIADRYGVLIKILKEQGTPIPTNDVWIAATALEKGIKLATFNAHFNNIAGIVKVIL